MTHPIHFVWTGPERPAWVDANIARAKLLHPDRDVILHDESILHEPWRHLYEKQHLIARADMLKLSVARKEGGWLIDTDCWFLRPIDIYEKLRGVNAGWWGTTSMGYFGADGSFPWAFVDDLLPDLPRRRNAVFDLMNQWGRWDRGSLFDCVPETTLVIAAASEAGLYHRLISGLPTSVGTRLLLHGHRSSVPVPDAAIL